MITILLFSILQQVDLSQPYRVTHVATQGRQDYDQWVKEYKVSCSSNGIDFTIVQGVYTNVGSDMVRDHFFLFKQHN